MNLLSVRRHARNTPESNALIRAFHAFHVLRYERALNVALYAACISDPTQREIFLQTQFLSGILPRWIKIEDLVDLNGLTTRLEEMVNAHGHDAERYR